MDETLTVSSDSASEQDHPTTFEDFPCRDLSPSIHESLAEGWDVAIQVEPTPESLHRYPFARFQPHPKISAIKYRTPKVFSWTLPQNPPPDPSKPQRQLFSDHSEVKAEEVILESDECSSFSISLSTFSCLHFTIFH